MKANRHVLTHINMNGRPLDGFLRRPPSLLWWNLVISQSGDRGRNQREIIKERSAIQATRKVFLFIFLFLFFFLRSGPEGGGGWAEQNVHNKDRE